MSPRAGGKTTAEYLREPDQEVLHHGAEIALLRDRYLARHATDGAGQA